MSTYAGWVNEETWAAYVTLVNNAAAARELEELAMTYARDQSADLLTDEEYLAAVTAMGAHLRARACADLRTMDGCPILFVDIVTEAVTRIDWESIAEQELTEYSNIEDGT